MRAMRRDCIVGVIVLEDREGEVERERSIAGMFAGIEKGVDADFWNAKVFGLENQGLICQWLDETSSSLSRTEMIIEDVP